MSRVKAAVDVSAAIGSPTTSSEDGARLAQYLLANRTNWDSLILDVTTLPPVDLISSFINSLFHTLEEAGVDLSQMRQVRWIAKFEGEKRRLEKLTSFYMEAKAVNS